MNTTSPPPPGVVPSQETKFKPPSLDIEPPPTPPPLLSPVSKKKEEEKEEEKEEKEDTSKKNTSSLRMFMDSWTSDSMKGIFITNLMFGFFFFVIGYLNLGFVLCLILVLSLTYVQFNFAQVKKRQLRQDQISKLVHLHGNGLDKDLLSMMMKELPIWVRFPYVWRISLSFFLSLLVLIFVSFESQYTQLTAK